MSILKRLQVNHFRNLQSVAVDLSPSVNIFYGDNGSGKTSLLESISLLGLGRSFRSHKSRSLVNHEQKELTVFAELFSDTTHSLLPIGIQKARNGTSIIRMSGDNVRSASTLAKQLPLLIINATSFQLIEGSPNQRRQFLDWMVFHVKPEFSGLWKSTQKILKQRNSLLRRDKIAYSEIEVWDIELCRLAEAIDQVRQEAFTAFVKHFESLDTEFTTQNLAIEMEYIRGWDNTESYQDILKSSFDKDRRDGYTHYGPQRADIKIRAQQKLAVDVLSRGQEKALVCAMTIAQAHLYKAYMRKSCVFLVDDLLAELDKQHCKQLAHWLTALEGQVFITGISKEGLLESWKDETTPINLFHVKQGEVMEDDSHSQTNL